MHVVTLVADVIGLHLPFLEVIRQSHQFDGLRFPGLDELVVANTIPMTKTSKKIKMLSTASMLGEVIRRVHNNESVNSLFETNT